MEEYTADLKRLYNKAHPSRDHQTREELLRRFLDGLSDSQARFHVEYMGPDNISSVCRYQWFFPRHILDRK